MCAFCDLLADDSDGRVVFSDEVSVGFLDFRPLFHGHTLLVPRRHVETVWELPDELVGPYFRNVQLLARAMPEVLGAEGAFVAINNRISQSVPHLHTHIVPRRPRDGLRGFFWPRTTYGSDDEMHELAARMRPAIAELAGKARA
jgi:histidine triad (HIT) family protein